MSVYAEYLAEIETRKGMGLHPKPIEDAVLVEALVEQIRDSDHKDRSDSLKFFIYNTLPGTTSAAAPEAIPQGNHSGSAVVPEISIDFAFELLGHMKGGSVEVLLDLALGNDAEIASQAATVLKTKVFL